MVIAQGGEGGGHTGDISNSILIPAVVDVAKKYKSSLTGQPALVSLSVPQEEVPICTDCSWKPRPLHPSYLLFSIQLPMLKLKPSYRSTQANRDWQVVAAGGLSDGRSLASSLMQGVRMPSRSTGGAFFLCVSDRPYVDVAGSHRL